MCADRFLKVLLVNSPGLGLGKPFVLLFRLFELGGLLSDLLKSYGLTSLNFEVSCYCMWLLSPESTVLEQFVAWQFDKV